MDSIVRTRKTYVTLMLTTLGIWAAMLASTMRPALAALPGASGKIVFESLRDGDMEIYVMNANGSSQINLTNNPVEDIDPAFSPDGTKIAFTSLRNGNREIYVMNADGSNPINLTNHPADDIQPAFSPDGTQITFATSRGGNREIYIMNADGSNLINLTNHSATDRGPAFSPDGAKIAFRSNRDGNDEIYLMNADGTGQTRLTNNPAEEFGPAFSPDGTKIAFTSTRDGNDEIYLMNLDGTGQTNITNSPLGDNYPSFSPDGTKIAYRSARDSNREIYVMNLDGTNQTRLTTDPAEDLDPDWGSASSSLTSTPPTDVPTGMPTDTTTSTPTDTPNAPPTNTPTATFTSTASPTGIADVIFADGFESGNLSHWSSATTDMGDLSASTSAALAGDHGLQVLIDDNKVLYVADDSPDAEPRYRMRFYFDPNSILMNSNDNYYLFHGYTGASTLVLRLQLRFSNGSYQLRGALRNDNSTWVNSSWFSLNDASHLIEIDWRAATASGANNGGLALWIDGTQRANLTGVDNDTRRIDRVRLGAVAGVDTGTRGTYHIDAFEARRQTYIGP